MSKGKKKRETLSSGGQTVFVCVRERGGKSASCAGSGARAVLSQIRAALGDEAIDPGELQVRPCGCLGLCKQGPVLMAASGIEAQQKKPRKPKKKQGGVYTEVHAGEDVRTILRDRLRTAAEAAREGQTA